MSKILIYTIFLVYVKEKFDSNENGSHHGFDEL